MPAPVAVFLAPTIGGAALLSKKKQARRAQAASNKWSTQFPLVDDYASQQAMISQAQLQLKTLQAQGSKSKQVRAEIAQLSKWIGVMKAQLKDLKTGLDMASTNMQKAPTNCNCFSPTSSCPNGSRYTKCSYWSYIWRCSGKRR
jgi:hypothetical protein